MTTGPTVRRRRLGTELRRLRESNGFKLEEVAAQLGVAPSTLSRIETGKAPTKSAYLNQMLEMLRRHRPGAAPGPHRHGPRGPPQGLVGGLRRRAAQRIRHLRGTRGRDGRDPRLRDLGRARAAADAATTPARCCREMFPRHSAEQIERLVDLRIERQRRLDDDPPLELWAILDEAVIRRPVGGTKVMRAQLEHLLAMADAARADPADPAVLLRRARRARRPVLHPRVPEQDPTREVSYVESVAGIIYLEKDREMRLRAEAFDRLIAAALSPGASVEMIAQVADDLR